MTKTIQFIKSGCVLREYPMEFYSLSWMNTCIVVLDKETKAPVFIPSPQYYDYIEVQTNES